MKTIFNESIVSESLVKFDIEESASEVDNIHILAKVKGPAFFPNIVSKNNVFYSTDAWEHAISNPDLRRKLADRLVFGTIGHNSDLTDDDIREGRFSHIVTNIWLDENNVGNAEYLIYNTKPGKYLNMLLRTGSKLRVSTKAQGYFESNINSKVKTVIPDQFTLDRIDFVIDPGYIEALPSVTESIQEEHKLINERESIMDEKVVSILEGQIIDLKEQNKITESVATLMRTEAQKISEALIVSSSSLKLYESIGTYPMIQESISELAQYQKLGTVHDIFEAIESGEEVIGDLTKTIDDLQNKIKSEPEEYKDLGQPSDIKAALDQALTSIAELEAYKALGSVTDFQELINKTGEMAEAMEEEEAQAIADEFSVDKGVVVDLLGKGFSLDDVKDLLEKLKPVVTEEELDADGNLIPKYEDEDSGIQNNKGTDELEIAGAGRGSEKGKTLEIPENRRSTSKIRTTRKISAAPSIKESKSSATISRVAKLMGKK